MIRASFPCGVAWVSRADVGTKIVNITWELLVGHLVLTRSLRQIVDLPGALIAMNIMARCTYRWYQQAHQNPNDRNHDKTFDQSRMSRHILIGRYKR